MASVINSPGERQSPVTVQGDSCERGQLKLGPSYLLPRRASGSGVVAKMISDRQGAKSIGSRLALATICEESCDCVGIVCKWNCPQTAESAHQRSEVILRKR